MTTIPRVIPATNPALQLVTEHGWRRGFANLLHNENRMWWGTRKWLVHLLLWLIVLNGLILLVGISESRETNHPSAVFTTLIQVFFQVAALQDDAIVLADDDSAPKRLALIPFVALPIDHSAAVPLARLRCWLPPICAARPAARTASAPRA